MLLKSEKSPDQKITHQSVFSVQMKNCEPFVLGPEFAIDIMPGEKHK